MQAFVVKVKYITNYQHPKKPAVMLKISKNLLSNTADEGNNPSKELISINSRQELYPRRCT